LEKEILGGRERTKRKKQKKEERKRECGKTSRRPFYNCERELPIIILILFIFKI